MWWEDLYQMYIVACNLEVMETNDNMKFNFMLHAGSKDAIKKWQDLEIPFPSKDYMKAVKKKGSLATRPELRHGVFRRARKVEKMDDAQRERFNIVKEKLEAHKKKLELDF